jgi:hypothetical protein
MVLASATSSGKYHEACHCVLTTLVARFKAGRVTEAAYALGKVVRLLSRPLMLKALPQRSLNVARSLRSSTFRCSWVRAITPCLAIFLRVSGM